MTLGTELFIAYVAYKRRFNAQVSLPYSRHDFPHRHMTFAEWALLSSGAELVRQRHRNGIDISRYANIISQTIVLKHPWEVVRFTGV